MFFNIFLLFFISSTIVFVMSFLNIDEKDKIVITILSTGLFLFLAGLSWQVQYILQDGSILAQDSWIQKSISAFIFLMFACVQVLRLVVISYAVKEVQNG
jgi:hypothetical protein